MIGLPSLLGLIFFLGGGPNPIPIIIVGYLVQIALAAKAITAREESIRRACYLIFRCLLVLDVCVAWFGPKLALLLFFPEK
jgi:hypothetical protein